MHTKAIRDNGNATTHDIYMSVRYDDVLQTHVSEAKQDNDVDKAHAKDLLKFLAMKEKVYALQNICAQLHQAARRSGQLR